MKARSAWTEFPANPKGPWSASREDEGVESWVVVLTCEESHGVPGREVLLNVSRDERVHLGHRQLARQARRRQARLAVLVDAPAILDQRNRASAALQAWQEEL